MTDELESASADPLMTPVEARILGSLIEKEATTPETYPLTLNALVAACNQKTSREPVMHLEPGQVGQALRRMEERGLVRLIMGARADRWEHLADKALEITPPQRVLLGLLLLRGPQTVSELLTRSVRMHEFTDAEQVRYQLERLITREYAVHLPRQGGQREDRFMHLLCGPVDAEMLAPAPRTSRPSAESEADLRARIDHLEARVAALEAKWADLE